MSAKQTILVIEDEAHIATMLRYNLEKAGYAVVEVTSGDEAMHRIAEHKPDAVLLDWGLPGMSGYEVCRQIRASSEYRTLPGQTHMLKPDAVAPVLTEFFQTHQQTDQH